MKKTFIASAVLALALGTSAAMADPATAPGQNKTTSGPGVARECVLTFTSPEAIAAGADVDVVKAQLMPVQSNSTKNSAQNSRTDIYQYANDALPGGTCLTNNWGPN